MTHTSVFKTAVVVQRTIRYYTYVCTRYSAHSALHGALPETYTIIHYSFVALTLV